MQGVNLINKASIIHKVSRSLTGGVAVFIFVASLAACQSQTDEAAIGSTPAWLKVQDFYVRALAGRSTGTGPMANENILA